MVSSKTILDFSEEKIKNQQMYCKKISMRYEEYSLEIQQLIFSAFFSPSVWEDAPKIYEKIVNSISFLEGELPVMFIGGSSQNRITRNEQSAGFFITDYTIYVLIPSVFSDTLPKKFPYSNSIDNATETVNKAIDSFDWEFLEAILPNEGKESLSQLLLESVSDILTLKKDLNIEHTEVKKSHDLKGRVIDFALVNDSCIKIGDYNKYQKHFKKIHKKFNIPDSEHIQFVVTDSTLFGPYGMAITEKNIYSKDLMEQPICTNKSDILPDYPVDFVENSLRMSDNIIHVLPSTLDNKEAVKQIIIELLNGEIVP